MSSVGNKAVAAVARGPGFTLLELVTALALMAVLSALIGVALPAGGTRAAVISAQDLASSSLARARMEAALAGARARLMVYRFGSPATDPEKVLRFLLVVVEKPDGGWRLAGPAVSLPRGACVVPPDPSAFVRTPWGSAPVSSFTGQMSLSDPEAGPSAMGSFYFVEFSPTGTSTAAIIVVAPALLRPTANGRQPEFSDPAQVRGIKLSQYGVQTLLPHANAF